MVSRPQKIILLKLLSLVSVVRGYAIALMIAAQLFTAAFILSPEAPLSEVLLSGNLWWLILATALSIAGGYIINNFYDQEKDLINRRRRSKLDQMLRQQTKLSGYFILNFASVLDHVSAALRPSNGFSVFQLSISRFEKKTTTETVQCSTVQKSTISSPTPKTSLSAFVGLQGDSPP